MKANSIILCGVILAFLAVAIGAFGAHAWQANLHAHATTKIFATASQYHFIHALTLLWLGLYKHSIVQNIVPNIIQTKAQTKATTNQREQSNKPLTIATILLLLGTLIFSGSLYILALSGVRWLGAITPIGGLLLLSAWATIAYGVYKQQRTESETKN